MIRRRLTSTVNRPRGAKSGLTAKAREILDRTRKLSKKFWRKTTKP